MTDYYARLETQLADLTARGAHRRRRVHLWRPTRTIRAEVLWLGAAALVVVAIAVAVLAAQPVKQGTHRPARRARGPAGAAVLMNSYPAPLPAPSSPLQCNATLRAGAGAGSAQGDVRIYTKPPTRYEMFLTASGLRPISSLDVYAVWILPATQTASAGYQLVAGKPELLGVVAPSPGSAGRVSSVSLLPQALNGAYKILITVQSRRDLGRPGTVVLTGFVAL
jgi:hypothetical protein